MKVSYGWFCDGLLTGKLSRKRAFRYAWNWLIANSPSWRAFSKYADMAVGRRKDEGFRAEAKGHVLPAVPRWLFALINLSRAQ
jgi:hypothetical protein